MNTKLTPTPEDEGYYYLPTLEERKSNEQPEQPEQPNGRTPEGLDTGRMDDLPGIAEILSILGKHHKIKSIICTTARVASILCSLLSILPDTTKNEQQAPDYT